MAAVVILGLAGGGAAAWELLGQHGTRPHPAADGPTHGAGQPGQGSPGSPAAGSPTPAAPSRTPAPSPTASGGQFTVAVGPTVPAQPALQQVVSFLRSYFTAINGHDYGRYVSLVTPALRPTPGQFQTGYASTTDSAAALTALSPTADGMAATVRFTSHQLPSASHTGSRCTEWRITLFLRAHGTGYRIEPPPPGYHSHSRPC